MGHNGVFPFQFRAGVNAVATRTIVFAKWPVIAIIIDIIGAEMDKPNVGLKAGCGEAANAFHIDEVALVGFGFRTVNGRVGGSVEADVGLGFGKGSTQVRWLGDIERRTAVRKNTDTIKQAGGSDDFLAKLTPGTTDHYSFH
jgi:hypothetical protein